VYLALRAGAARPPREALRELLALDGVLDGLIDEAAQRYDGGVHAKHRLTAYHDFFVSRVKAGERVLDVGCGYGAVAHSLARRAEAVVVGIDLDPGNIAEARRRFAHPRLTFVVGDATQTLPGGEFDVVVASNVIEHIERRAEFYRAVQARARPARWLVRVPMIDRDWQVPLRRELGLLYFSDPTHQTEYTRESFEAEARDAGLRVGHLQVNWGEIWAELVPGG
jgi:2-polyprenyl-3-methyl-5-hydroxy-6-metoxy-1,4-benzoquinol methylase